MALFHPLQYLALHGRMRRLVTPLQTLKRGLISPGTPAFVQKHSHLDVVYRRNSDMQAWLDSHFERAPRLPALDAAGFLPVGARLLATASGPAAMVFYEDRHGDTISFYVRLPSAAGLLHRGHRQEGNLVAEYGSENGYAYAVVSHADTRDQEIVRNALHTLT